jgi:hypothetical protein
MTKNGGMILAVLLAIGLVAVPANATVVEIEGCPSCFGSTYELNIVGTGPSYTATLTIDTSGYTGPATHISAVNFKASSDVSSMTLTSAPGGTAAWATGEANIGNAGCGGGGEGFVCSQDAAAPGAALGGTLVWSWNFTPTGSLFPDLLGAHIGAKYNNASGTLNGQIMSEEFAQVPEPSTLLLLGTGLLGLAGFGWLRRR